MYSVQPFVRTPLPELLMKEIRRLRQEKVELEKENLYFCDNNSKILDLYERSVVVSENGKRMVSELAMRTLEKQYTLVGVGLKI